MPVHIPPEILDEIFDIARGSPPKWQDDIGVGSTSYQPVHPNATLLSASLVCKAWAESAQRALCRHAIFPTRLQEGTYAAWIESDARRRSEDRRTVTVSLWIRPCTQPHFGQVLGSLEGAESLTLDEPLFDVEYVEDSCISPVSWDVLRCPGLKGEPPELRPPVRPPQLIEAITDLKALSIVSADSFAPSTAPFTPLPFSLTTLEYWFYDNSEQATSLLEALIRSSQDTLHTVKLRVSGNQFYDRETCLEPVARQIRHLIVIEDFRDNQLLWSGLGDFDALEKLELWVSNRDAGWESFGQSFDSIIATLPTPNSLRHLLLEINHTEELISLEEKLKDKSLKSLEVLELSDAWRNIRSAAGTDLEDVMSLEAECKRRSITLVYWNGSMEDMPQ